MALTWGVAQSAMDTEREPKSEPLSNRERLLTLLMFAFLGLVLLSRFSHSPRRWRSVDASMSPQELTARLGTPTFEGTNEMRWREKHLLANWELIAERKGTQVTSLRKVYHWPIVILGGLITSNRFEPLPPSGSLFSLGASSAILICIG
jgi:hypothetical protein